MEYWDLPPAACHCNELEDGKQEINLKLSKDTLAATTLLSHPVLKATTCLTTDASNVTVGTVLQQFIDDEWHLIAYLSRKLKPLRREIVPSNGNC